jgi:hypothetical protein
MLRTWGVRGVWHRAVAASDGLYSLWVRESLPARRVLRAQREWSQDRTTILSLVTFVADPTGWPDRERRRAWLAKAIRIGNGLSRRPRARSHTAGRTSIGCSAIDACRSSACLHMPRAHTRGNSASRAARGEFMAITGGRDTLSPEALYEMAAAMERAPGCDLLYSDEDRVSLRGSRRHAPSFKPDWSPDLLLARNYIGRLTMIRREAALAVGEFRDGYDGAEEWDLLLRLSRRTTRIQRIPQCLYHRADSDSPADTGAEEAAIRDPLRRARPKRRCVKIR